MAPEVIRQEPYGAAADVYSFGVLLFCLANGEDYPYCGRYLTPAQAALGVAKHKLRPKINHHIPSRIVQIMKMCWAPDPSSRPQMDVVISMLMSTEEALLEKWKQNKASHSNLYTWIWGMDNHHVEEDKRHETVPHESENVKKGGYDKHHNHG